MKRISILALGLFLALPCFGQSVLSRVAGKYVATSYGSWSGQISSGNTATGSATIAVASGTVTLPDGTVIEPYSTNAPITVGTGASQETVTPTAVSGCAPNSGNGSCLITASFTYTHGQGDRISSGTAGLQEAIDAANANGGGVVEVSYQWYAKGGTVAILQAAAPFYNVSIRDDSAVPFYWTAQPSTLTALATPATRTATAGATQVISSTVTGTFPNAAVYVCVTYIDLLGGESPCSASYTFTPSDALHGIFFNAPAASTGAVGWRAYEGITGTSTQYQLPITSAICTLSKLENVVTACAMSSNATFTTPVTTTGLAPGYVVNVYRPVFLSHTTFAYQPSYSPHGFQAHFGPFAATGNIPATDVAVLGSVHLPAGLFNNIGSTIRVTGKIAATAVNTATWTIALSLGPIWTTGTPTAVCSMLNTFPFTSAAYNATFQCDFNTNAVSATAGTIMTDGYWIGELASGSIATFQPVAVDTGTAAIGTLDTADQDDLFVILTSGTAATNPAQLVDLHVETIN